MQSVKVIFPYAKNHIPKLCNPAYPQSISELYNSDMLNVGYIELLAKCEAVLSEIKVYMYIHV